MGRSPKKEGPAARSGAGLLCGQGPTASGTTPEGVADSRLLFLFLLSCSVAHEAPAAALARVRFLAASLR